MGCRSGHDFSLSHYVDAGKVASFSNSGTRGWANCTRVFEFSDYSDREYTQERAPRALLIARVDLAPGTQARPPLRHRPAARAPTGARLTQGAGAGAGRGRCGGTTPWTRCRAGRASRKTWTCRSRRRRTTATAAAAAREAVHRLAGSGPGARHAAPSESVHDKNIPQLGAEAVTRRPARLTPSALPPCWSHPPIPLAASRSRHRDALHRPDVCHIVCRREYVLMYVGARI